MAIKRIDVGARMSQCVVHGNTVYTAGQVAQRAAGKSITEQTKDILATMNLHLGMELPGWSAPEETTEEEEA